MSIRYLTYGLAGLAAFGLTACDTASDGATAPQTATGDFDAAVFANADELIVSSNPSADDRAFRYRNPNAFAQRTAFFRQKNAGSDVTSFQTVKFEEFQNEFFATFDVSSGTGGRLVRYSRKGALLAQSDGVLVSPKGFDTGYFPDFFFSDGRFLVVADIGLPEVRIFDAVTLENIGFLDNPTGSTAWDVHFDQDTGYLFAANTNGTVTVTPLFGPGAQDEFQLLAANGVTPAVNNHGITFDAETNTLIVSDVGMADDPADGAIHVVDYNPAIGSGGSAVAARATYAGANTLLGNPVDIAGSGSSVFVAEKANDGGRMLRFDNVLEPSGSLDMAPDAVSALDNPESVDVLLREAIGQEPEVTFGEGDGDGGPPPRPRLFGQGK